MKAILLAAGFGTRVQHLFPGIPKALIPITSSRVVLDYIIDRILATRQMERIYLVSNALHFDAFKAWRAQRGLNKQILIVNNGVLSNENRLGAIGDLQFAIDNASIGGDLFIVGTDNIFTFSFNPLITLFNLRQAPVLAILREPNFERVKLTAEVVLGHHGRIVSFIEKPSSPTSEMISPPLYIFNKDTVPLIRMFLTMKKFGDSPGQLMEWLYSRRPIYGLVMPGGRYNIGSEETYEEAKKALDKSF